MWASTLKMKILNKKFFFEWIEAWDNEENDFFYVVAFRFCDNRATKYWYTYYLLLYTFSPF